MAAIIVNDGSTNADLFRVVDAAGFPAEDFSISCQVWFTTIRASAFGTIWSWGPNPFSGGSDYQVPFFGDGAVSPNFAIGSNGSDTYDEQTTGIADGSLEGGAGIAPATGRWYRMAYTRKKNGVGNYDQTFWFDIGTSSAKIIRHETNAVTGAVGHKIMFGSNPWVTTGNEGIDGKQRAGKAWGPSIPSADLLAESAYSSIVVPANNGSLWGRWPMVSDGNDVSGNARHLTAEGAVTFDGTDILPSLGGQMLMGVG